MNYAALRDEIYPAEVLALFERLGVDYRKEAEVSHFGREVPGRHVYGWFLHFVGRIVASDVPPPPPYRLPTVPVTAEFAIGFWERADLTHEPLRGFPLVQVECWMQLPWVIEAEEAG